MFLALLCKSFTRTSLKSVTGYFTGASSFSPPVTNPIVRNASAKNTEQNTNIDR